MTPWLVSTAVLVAAFAVLAGTGGLIVRRYCGSHMVAHLAIAGRGWAVRQPDAGRDVVAAAPAPVPARVRRPGRLG